MDQNNDGSVSFNEFRQLSAENRIDLNPYSATDSTASVSGMRLQSRGSSQKEIISKRLKDFKQK